MKYFKILFQPNEKNPPFYKQVFLKDCIVSKKGYSFAIPYSPQDFNAFLMDDQIYNIFVYSTVKQLMLSNHKYLNLILMQDRFNLSLVDCKFKNYEIEDLLEGEEFNLESIEALLQNQDYEIMQLFFRSKGNHMVTLKSNGVLGIDSGLSEEEYIDVKKLIEFISFGPRMLV
ncbi:hypothetical protein Pryu01_02475 [Paraliobacillus ryukyuensis]|uniref:Uncharacterized protein n=1 Tax=Paraliobacillus ryukyuensis TaxID=200904 RepID=A0A366DWI5_9BACI|nr:TetR family transcriptional regulator [Paraliobacillus ryukyuensis]RBO93538.1 hypothetical protein DES48_11148 [Paraliobacillus ryukyuensis]